MDFENYLYTYKIILLGDAGVGKSSFVSRIINRNFPDEHYTTIGVEFASTLVKLQNNENIKLLIWDTAGQERYRSITKSYYNNVIGCYIFFDLSKEESFNNLNYWIEQISEKINNKSGVIFLVGNKLDLINKRKIHNEKINELLCKYNNIDTIKYFEVTIRNNEKDADLLIKNMAQEIYEKVEGKKIKKEEVRKLDDFIEKNKNKKCC